MNKKISLLVPIVALLVAWLSCTLVVDFLVVPAVFKTIPDFFKAGELAMALFEKFNALEMVLSVVVFSLARLHYRQNKSSWPIFLFSFLGFLLILFYLTYLTPKITYLTEIWMKAGSETVNNVDIQQEHQFYHNFYRNLDTLKIVVLSAMILISWKKSDKWA